MDFEDLSLPVGSAFYREQRERGSLYVVFEHFALARPHFLQELDENEVDTFYESELWTSKATLYTNYSVAGLRPALKVYRIYHTGIAQTSAKSREIFAMRWRTVFRLRRSVRRIVSLFFAL